MVSVEELLESVSAIVGSVLATWRVRPVNAS
jgi:hypothetical protein